MIASLRPRPRLTYVFLFVTATSLSLAATPAPVAHAQGLADQAHSLRIVPADAAFYSASLRLKEQWDIFLASNAYARLMEIPFVQMIKMQADYQWNESNDDTITMFRQYVESPAGQDALALVKEMMSDEIYCYGGADVANLLELLLELNSFNQSLQFEVMGGGGSEVIADRVFEWLDQHAEQLKIPDVVIGFRVRDRARATRHLDAIQASLRGLLEDAPPELVARLKREQIAGHEFLTLRLDGSLLPWDEIRAGASELDDAEFEKWKALAVGKTLVVAIGVVDDFVVASIGDSSEHLKKLGQGPLLADNPAFARLARHADQRVASIGFVSEALMTKVSSPRRSMNDLANTAARFLQMAPISDVQRTQLVEDIRGFSNDLVKYLPVPGHIATIGFLTPRGYESFRYNYGTMPTADSSRPLAMLDHVGGNPMLFVASHGKGTVEDYDLMVGWVKRIAGHVEEIIDEHAPPDEWARYVEIRNRVVELLKRLDRANREQLIPATRENEQAFVMDVASQSLQWVAPMPPARRPLPMLEIGFATRVSDAALYRQGVAEYMAVIQDALTMLHELAPDEIPEIRLPEPQKRDLAGGALYTFPFPAAWGVDPQLAASAGWTETTAAASLLPAFTDRLLTPTSLAIDTSIDLHRPAAMVVHVQCAKFFDAVRPWIDYGFAVATGHGPGDEAADGDDQAGAMMAAGFILPQIHQSLDVLSALRSYTSITYHEEDAWVTHAETRIKDLE